MKSEISSLSQLVSLLRDNQPSGVYSLKPRVLLELLESREPPSKREFQMVFPPVSIGSPSAFEATMLCLLIKLLNPMKLVEIGTYTAYTTCLMAKNSHDSAQIVSIDLPPGTFFSSKKSVSSNMLIHDWRMNDDFLRQAQSDKGSIYLEALTTSQIKKVLLLKEDSTSLSPETLCTITNAEFFFIDGGHSLDNIKSDTLTGLSCLSAKGVIAWHDYSSRIHHEVTLYIDDVLSNDHVIFHIQGTTLAVFFKECHDIFSIGE